MRRVVIQVIGIRRSGNHAVIAWIQSLFGRAIHYNNLPHDVFARPDQVERVRSDLDSDCIICSFEDFPLFHKTDRSLSDSVAPINPALIGDDREYFTFYIIRDVYNLFASLLKSGRIAGEREILRFIDDWLSVARQYEAAPERCILYNEWFASDAYRRALCDRLGVPYREDRLDEVAREGKGSSFDGLPRPPVRDIVRGLPRYVSPAFLRRLARNPTGYLTRLFAKPVDARALDVQNRWKYLSEREERFLLMRNEEVHELNERIFGFRLNDRFEVCA
jgi:hypothetical protein